MESLSGITEIFGAGAAGSEAAGTAIEGATASIGEGAGASTAGGVANTVAEGLGNAAEFVNQAASAVGEKVVTPAANFAQGAGEYVGGKAKDFFSQAWDNAKSDIGEKVDKMVVRDESGKIDGGKTAGNLGYEGAKALMSRAFASGGGEEDQLPDMSQAKAPPVQQAEAAMPDAENELNKLRNMMNSLG